MALPCPDTTCSIYVNSRCTFYESVYLPYTGISTNDSLQTALQKIELAIKTIIDGGGSGGSVWGSITGTLTNQTDLTAYLSTNYTPQSRILTINGVAFDLSANRSWSIPTTLTNGNGTIGNGSAADLGGLLTTSTSIDKAGFDFRIENLTGEGGSLVFKTSDTTISSDSQLQLDPAQAFLYLQNNTNYIGVDLVPTSSALVFNSPTSANAFQVGDGETLVVSDLSTFEGIKYSTDYSANYVPRSIPDVGWVLDQISTVQPSLTGVQGDIIYFSGTDSISNLAKNTTATRYLSNTGTSNNPAWAQINLANGVTGDLPFANIVQGSARSVLGVTGNATADLAPIQGTANQILRINGAGTALAFGSIDLAQSASVGTSILPVVNGGTNLSTIPALSALITNTVNTITTISPAAGQSIRINAGGTAWESYSPSGIGGSTGAVDNAILRADGTGGSTMQSSVVTIGDTGHIILGESGTSGIDRNITAQGSSADVSINLVGKGIGTAGLTSGTAGIQASNNQGNSLNIQTLGHNLFLRQTALTNTVSPAAQVNHITSGTPVAGFGTSFQFLVQGDIGATIEAVYTDATTASEDVDLDFKTMTAGAVAAQRMKINERGIIVTGQLNLAALNTAPSSASDTGITGEIRIDANFIYVCTATDTWKRVAISTW